MISLLLVLSVSLFHSPMTSAVLYACTPQLYCVTGDLTRVTWAKAVYTETQM